MAPGSHSKLVTDTGSDVGLEDIQGAGGDRTSGKGVTETQNRALRAQQELAGKQPKPRIKTLRFAATYKQAGVAVSLAENKIGIMPNLEDILLEIAAEAGLDMADESDMARFIDALVTDVYVNPYSDKQTFDGEIVVGDGLFRFPRRHIKVVINKYVGTHYRRFARAMAPLVVEVMHDNPDFYLVLDKRCSELGLNVRSEAAHSFDGADALVHVDNATATRNARAKALALTKRPLYGSYSIENSAAAIDSSTSNNMGG